ncbi:MAG: TetR/AcrR family transcriptional regulator [Desulfobacter sp.]|nr:TetR/AcrR family transcriptional regulator [Desulfobacter sp.]WDP85089.1 MAG: TetR/AcrR family transcriptional regulator [Desulfobacter sp.]
MADSEKRNQILKAASHSFALYGFSKTTMDDIGKLVGLNKASLYYYYKNKEAIFCKIIERECQGFISSLEKKINRLSQWDVKIQAYLLERQQYLKETVNLHKLSVKTTEQLQFQPMFKTLAANFEAQESELIKNILDRAQADDLIHPVDTQKTAWIILSLADSMKSRGMDMKNGYMISDQFNFKTIAEDTRFAVELILEGLKKRLTP